ncbi:MAG: TRIC cation channel family protein [Anaerolineae bacterium]
MDFQQVISYALSHFGTWTAGSLTIVDLIAATTAAFNGALLARRPDHYRHWTYVGIILMAILAGIGGGVVRDILLNQIPAALTNPWYLILSSLAGVLGIYVAFGPSQRFRDGVYQFMLAFALPWYAVVGAQKALDAQLPLLACILIGVVGPTFGRYFVDITALLPPKHFVRGEWFVGTAVLTSVVYLVVAIAGMPFYAAVAIAFIVGFAFRVVAMWRLWEEPEPWEPDEAKAGEARRMSLGEGLRREFGKETQE